MTTGCWLAFVHQQLILAIVALDASRVSPSYTCNIRKSLNEYWPGCITPHHTTPHHTTHSLSITLQSIFCSRLLLRLRERCNIPSVNSLSSMSMSMLDAQVHVHVPAVPYDALLWLGSTGTSRSIIIIVVVEEDEDWDLRLLIVNVAPQVPVV